MFKPPTPEDIARMRTAAEEIAAASTDARVPDLLNQMVDKLGEIETRLRALEKRAAREEKIRRQQDRP